MPIYRAMPPLPPIPPPIMRPIVPIPVLLLRFLVDCLISCLIVGVDIPADLVRFVVGLVMEGNGAIGPQEQGESWPSNGRSDEFPREDADIRPFSCLRRHRARSGDC